MGIAGGRQNLENTALDIQDRNIEGSATEVVDRDSPLGQFLQAVRERRGGRLVHQPHDLDARQPPCIAGRLTLAIVEVSGNGDHHALDLFAIEHGFGSPLQLTQNPCGDFGRRVAARAHREADHRARGVGERVPLAVFGCEIGVTQSHVAFDRAHHDDVFGATGLELDRRRPDTVLPVVAQGDDRRQQNAAAGFGEHPGRAVLDHCNQAVSGAEVYAENT